VSRLSHSTPCHLHPPKGHRTRLTISNRRLKTSIYLPAQEEEPTPSKPSAKETNQKRRTTMNSRDAEYDDEVSKRMLEVSKQEARANAESNRGARGREGGSSEGSDEYVAIPVFPVARPNARAGLRL
jgi:hypothetical protein